jgi:hypothetical protein
MNDGGKLRVPTALDKVLERLSIVDGHPLGCPCPRCVRMGDAYKQRAEAVSAERAELELELEQLKGAA